MRAAFAIAALAGSAIAAPSYGNGYGSPKPVENVHVVVETVVKTVYVTEGYEVPAATSTSVFVAPPAPTTTVVEYPVVSMPAYGPPAPVEPAPEAPKPTYAPEPAPQPTYAPEPAPKPTPTPEPAPAPPATGGYMDVISEYRSKMGLQPLAHSAKLEGTSLDTAQSVPGVMNHKLNEGVYGQVLAEGGKDDFFHVYVGGWLCERSNAPGLGNICQTASDGWDYKGQTGHADILTSPDYKSIGCSYSQNIWCCDLAY